MADIGYSVVTTGAVALAAGVAKSILGVKSHANFGLSLTHSEVCFDGVTASAVPVLIELCYATFATNPPGTASTSVTPAQEYGRVVAVGATGAKTWTTEPTVLTPIVERLLTPNGGLVIYDWPLGREPDCALAEGWVLRCTSPAVVNVRATLKFRRA